MNALFVLLTLSLSLATAQDPAATQGERDELCSELHGQHTRARQGTDPASNCAKLSVHTLVCVTREIWTPERVC